MKKIFFSMLLGYSMNLFSVMAQVHDFRFTFFNMEWISVIHKHELPKYTFPFAVRTGEDIYFIKFHENLDDFIVVGAPLHGRISPYLPEGIDAYMKIDLNRKN